MKLKTRAVAALALALAAAPLWAETTPAKKELVAKILEAQKAEIQSVAFGLADQSIAPLMADVQMLLRQQPPGEKRDAIAREIQGDVKKYGDEVVPLLRERAWKLAPTTIGTALEEKFSEDELKQLLATLESPVYARWRQLSGELGQGLAQKLVADVRPTLEPKMRALQQSIGRRLGLEPAASAASAPKAAAKPPAAASKK